MVLNTKSGGGRTLVNGTAYAIEFVKKLKLTITNTISTSKQSGSVIYQGNTYTSGTLEVEQGETVTIALKNSTGNDWCFVGVNGKTVASDTSHVEYIYAVTKNASVKFDGGGAVTAYITEQ